MIVADASIALTWLLNEPNQEAARQCFEKGGVAAPDLALAEIANGIWSACRGGRVDAETATALVAASLGIYDELAPQAELQESAFEIARELDHPIYDCSYIALAALRRCPLLTLDMRLQRRTSGTRWRNLISVLTP